MPSKRQLAVIHVAKKQLCLTDDDYRAILRSVGGVDSARDLEGSEFSAVMGYFEYLGFEPLGTVGKHYGARRGMATPAQVQFIRDLWREFKGTFEEAALDGWLSNTFGVASLRFVDTAKAGKIIVALKAMTSRARQA